VNALEHARVLVNGAELHYVTAGSGPPVILLHGWPVTWRHFHRLIPLLTADGWRVIAPDLRGLGDSARSAGPYSTPALAEDIATLASMLDADRYAVVGHDWGGSVAYALAASHRRRITHLIVEEELLPGFRVELPDGTSSRYPTWHGAFHAAPGVPELLIPGKEREYLGLFWGLTHESGAIAPADVDEYLRTYTAPETLRCWLAYYRDAAVDGEWNRQAARSPLQIPVMALGGAAAIGTAVEASVKQVATHVVGTVLPDCGHYPSYERPEAVAHLVTSFLRRRHATW
jgi:pimeloyl-ACP methyl ester carboxylesterase